MPEDDKARKLRIMRALSVPADHLVFQTSRTLATRVLDPEKRFVNLGLEYYYRSDDREGFPHCLWVVFSFFRGDQPPCVWKCRARHDDNHRVQIERDVAGFDCSRTRSWTCDVKERKSHGYTVQLRFSPEWSKEMDREDKETRSDMRKLLQTRYLKAAKRVWEACMDERLLMAVQACVAPTLWISRAPTDLGELTVTLKTSRHGTRDPRGRVASASVEKPMFGCDPSLRALLDRTTDATDAPTP